MAKCTRLKWCRHREARCRCHESVSAERRVSRMGWVRVSTCEPLYSYFPWEQHQQSLPPVLIICCWRQLPPPAQTPLQSLLDPDQSSETEPFLTFSTLSLTGPRPGSLTYNAQLLDRVERSVSVKNITLYSLLWVAPLLLRLDQALS